MSRFLRIPEVLKRVGLSRSTLYARIADGQFPRPIKIGERVAVWDETAIESWQDEHRERARLERDVGDAGVVK